MEKKEIPNVNISLDSNKIELPTKEVPIKINGEEKVVVLQKLSAGKRRDIVKKSMNMKIVGTQMTGGLDVAGYQINVLIAAIIKAPFDIDDVTISSVPDEVIDYLYNEYESAFGSKKKD